MDIGSDGVVTVYSAPGIYSGDQFHPIASRPLSLHAVRAMQAAANLDVANLLNQASNRYALPTGLLTAVAWNESRFQSAALSPKGAVGVMQLMDGTARNLGVDRYDLSQNILGGAAYLKQMMTRYDGDISLAVAAYNAGPGAVDQHRGIPPFPQTQNYVRNVMGSLTQPIQAAPPSVTFIDR